MATSRFPSNLGDDVLGQSKVEDSEDGNAYSIIKLPPDENLLHNEVYQGQYISGAGEKTNEDCGDFKSAYMNQLRHLRVKRFTCHLQSCPSCFRIWARRQATSAAAYLWAFVNQYHRELAHWTLSPSDEWLSKRSTADKVWKDLDKELRGIIEQFKGFNDTIVMIVRHPSRKRCPTCHSQMKDKESWCRVCWQPAEWYWSPHLHVITDFHFREEESSNYVQYEAANQIIFARKSFPPDQDQLENVISYELGHALYLPGQQKQAVRYLGLCAKTHYRSEVTRTKERVSEDDPLDPNLKHFFYMLKRESLDEREPGLLVIKKTNGKFPFKHDFYDLNHDIDGRIPLMRTRIAVRVVPLGQWLNGRWTRTVPARKIKSASGSVQVQPQILKVEPFQPFY